MRYQVKKGAPLRWGMNYRLHYGWDFGASPGPPLHLAAPDRAALLDADFATLAAAGCRLVRWLVFGDGRNGIRFVGEKPAGLDPCVAPALRVALDTAARHGIGILFVLLDHTLSFRPRGIPGTAMAIQGHGSLLRHADLFEALLGNVFAPFWDLIDNHSHVIGYELLNEPEMIMRWRRPPRPDPRRRPSRDARPVLHRQHDRPLDGPLGPAARSGPRPTHLPLLRRRVRF
jgi:hypothetical protein